MLSLDTSKFLELQVRNMHVAQPSCFEVTFSLSCKLSLLALKLQKNYASLLFSHAVAFIVRFIIHIGSKKINLNWLGKVPVE